MRSPPRYPSSTLKTFNLNMASFLKNTFARLTSSHSPADSGCGTAKTPEQLFPKTDPAVDGEDCLHDCASCSVKLPNKWSIEESDKLYGHVKGWETHAIVATGKSDWIRDVTDIKGSVMHALDHSKVQPTNGVSTESAGTYSQEPFWSSEW